MEKRLSSKWLFGSSLPLLYVSESSGQAVMDAKIVAAAINKDWYYKRIQTEQNTICTKILQTKAV